MKKILTLALTLILSASCFVGCGKKTASELSKTANNFVRAFYSAVVDLEENDISFPVCCVCSDGTNYYIGTSSSFETDVEDLKNKIKGYFEDCDEYSWIACMNGSTLKAFYCAEDFNSTVVGTYGEEILDVNGKNLTDIKEELKGKFTFNINIDDFISEFNENSGDDSHIEKSDDKKLLYYPFDNDSYFTVEYQESDGVISRMSVILDGSLSEQEEYLQTALRYFMAKPSVFLIGEIEEINEDKVTDVANEIASDLEESGYFIKYGIEYNEIDYSFIGESKTSISFSPLGFKSEN